MAKKAKKNQNFHRWQPCQKAKKKCQMSIGKANLAFDCE